MAGEEDRGVPVEVEESEERDDDVEMGTSLTEALKKLSVDIAEMYSPPRVTQEARRFGLNAGEAMDLVTGWDFAERDHRERAMRYINKHRPKLIVGSPMCTMFSSLQNLSKWTEEKERRWREDREHLKFMGEVYHKQINEGRWFLHEHPASASSWRLQEIRQVMSLPGVHVTIGDQCMFGLKTWGPDGRTWTRAKKSTKFMTNSVEISKELSQKCDRSHVHQRLTGARAGPSGRYLVELCRAICIGRMRELRSQGQNVKRLMDISHNTREARALEEREDAVGSQAWDDITGEELDHEAVIKARGQEMQYIGEKQVWELITRQEAVNNGWKIIKTRWIDIDKGDKKSPNYRSRLVAK